MHWEGNKHYSDPSFIQTSCKCPINYFTDKCDGIQWEYRQMVGPINDGKLNSEAIIIVPGIYESVSSYFRLMPLLAEHGYRILTLGYTDHNSFRSFPLGFNELMISLNIREIHFIGNGFGGFIILQLCSNPKKAWLAKSITLINSYTNTNLYNQLSLPSKPFRYLSSKSNLIAEFQKSTLLDKPTNSVLFIANELELMKNGVAANRVELRHRVGWPLDLQLPQEAILVIETADRISIPSNALPKNRFPNCKLYLLKQGGEFPHLENPEEMIPIILEHLSKWKEPNDISTPNNNPESVSN